MKKQMNISITTIGLAIFSMLFGAGNIIYPIKAGVVSGSKNFFGIAGFLLTGVILPVIGLVAMILFDGNFKKFFNRLGRVPGFLAILFCMLVIGPFIAMPRCITVPYDMLSPFLPASIGLPFFSIIFALITFLLTYKESKLLEVLGNVISPILVGSLGFICAKGLFGAQVMVPQTMNTSTVFFEQFIHGFQTLDLLGAMFFAYIVIRILKANAHGEFNTKQLALLSLQGGLIGASLLMAVYIGFSYLGAYYGHAVSPDMNGAQMFRLISLQVVHEYGVVVIITAVLMACFSTISALAAVLAEYLRYDIFQKRLGYIPCLIITLATTVFIANFGLSNILTYSAPFINIGYPIIISIVICNLAYSLFGFKMIKLPVAITSILVIGAQLYPYLLGLIFA